MNVNEKPPQIQRKANFTVDKLQEGLNLCLMIFLKLQAILDSILLQLKISIYAL